MIQTNNAVGGLVAMIQVRQDSKNIGLHRMQDGTSLILGRDESCGLRIEAPDVSSRHCVIRMTDGKLFVNDWYSDTGTLVNGEKIYCETMIRANDRVVVGSCELRFAVTPSEAALTASFDDPVATASAGCPDEVDETEPVGLSDAPAVGPPVSCPSDTAILESIEGLEIANTNTLRPDVTDECELEQQLLDANQEIQRLREELEYQLTLQPPMPAAAVAADPMSADDAELMRAEIEHLQTELTQRDAELAELLDSGPVHSAPVNDAETTKLVERLEQLLDELNDADQRVRGLEELVEVADEATRAEFEEREQLETWVSEIETRISDREQEFLAREEKLQTRLAEANQQKQEAATNLAKVVGGKGAEFQKQAQQQIAELTRRNTTLVTELEDSRQASQRLEKLMDEAGTSSEELNRIAEREARIRQHEIDLSQERARVARQKAELTKLRDQLERTSQSQELTDENPDVRTRAFRQHLQEIHEKEKQERKERSLSARISRIWHRLDGR